MVSSRLDRIEARIAELAELLQQSSTSSSQTMNGVLRVYRRVNAFNSTIENLKRTLASISLKQLGCLQRLEGKGDSPRSQESWATVSGAWSDPDAIAL